MIKKIRKRLVHFSQITIHMSFCIVVFFSSLKTLPSFLFEIFISFKRLMASMMYICLSGIICVWKRFHYALIEVQKIRNHEKDSEISRHVWIPTVNWKSISDLEKKLNRFCENYIFHIFITLTYKPCRWLNCVI